ncbi:hypothetical protein KUV85_08780 [Nocardioides panacisoli]|uniref:hypothetical protein n=1 Tax=Nocardioides panacisoli TaxID=627624 RepID=UPI001C634C43|nr:hypothetical protein [Nocardioides panacisoli]QYJ02434.1 hypothetical protein KUV85_08780 [Nocardioides panacisoli]
MSGSSTVRRTSLVRGLAAGALAGAVALTAGCGGEETDGTSGGAEPTVVEIEIAGDEVTPNGDRVEVGAGDPIDLEVTADEAGELHLHTEQEQTLPYEEGTQTIELQIDRPGVVVVESHELDQVIVQFEVR